MDCASLFQTRISLGDLDEAMTCVKCRLQANTIVCVRRVYITLRENTCQNPLLEQQQ